MQRLRIPILSAAAALILATPALASAQAGLVVEQKSTYNIARIGNADLKQKVMFHGNDRQKTVTEGRMRFLVFSRDAGGTEIVRLDQGQIHRLDDRRRQYQTNSIADLRGELEKAQKDAEAAAPESRQQDDVRLWVEAEPEGNGAEGHGERAADNTDPVGAAVGAMMRCVARPQEQPANPAATGRPLLFSMSNEVLSISAAASAASEFEIPAGYRKW